MKIQVILKHDENDDMPGRGTCPPDPEKENRIEVEVRMPDGRSVTAVANPAAGVLQNVVIVQRGREMDSTKEFEVWRGFVNASPGEGDIIEPLYETDSVDEAMDLARGYAAENFLPVVTWLKDYDRHLWSPIELLVEDGRGTMRYLLAGESVRSESGPFNPLAGIGLSETMSLDEIVDAVGAAWKVPCRVTVQRVPIIEKPFEEESEDDSDVEMEVAE